MSAPTKGERRRHTLLGDVEIIAPFNDNEVVVRLSDGAEAIVAITNLRDVNESDGKRTDKRDTGAA